MVDSIHSARFVRQFRSDEIEFRIFPSTPNRKIHRDLEYLESNIALLGGRLSLFVWLLDFVLFGKLRQLLLRRVSRKFKPDIIHALEFQHAAYLAEASLRHHSPRTTFIVSNFGSDIFWFQNFPRHLKRIRQVLARADRYSAECERDVKLAKQYGFAGETLKVFPNAGGFSELDLEKNSMQTSARRVIAVKGYEGWVGRASVALKALQMLGEELEGYDVIFYSCNRKILKQLNRSDSPFKSKVKAYRKHELSHGTVLDILSKARVYIGVSLSDGISTSLLESMAMGAFPIQTSTACVDEWFKDGVTGLAVKNFDPTSLANQIKFALESDDLVDRARIGNRATVVSRLVGPGNSAHLRDFYA